MFAALTAASCFICSCFSSLWSVLSWLSFSRRLHWKHFNQGNSSGSDVDSEEKLLTTLTWALAVPVLQHSPAESDTTNILRGDYMQSGLWPLQKSQTDNACPTWLLSSSFLVWLASSSELMEATCCTSWFFSVWVSSSWAVRVSTWAERSLSSASSLPIHTWNSAGTKGIVKMQLAQLVLYLCSVI